MTGRPDCPEEDHMRDDDEMDPEDVGRYYVARCRALIRLGARDGMAHVQEKVERLPEEEVRDLLVVMTGFEVHRQRGIAEAIVNN